MCAWGALCGFSSFGLVICALCLSMFCLGCIEPLPLPKGSETCLLQVILLFAFFVFQSLDGVSFSRFFFCFLLVTKTCVLSMHSSRGRLRAMCGSRTGGWSHSGVMRVIHNVVRIDS
jgi:hypothetical protein